MSTEGHGSSAVSAEAADAVRGVVKSLEGSFNAHDPISLSEHFADEASWSTIMGRRLDGRQAIADFGRDTMPELADQFARYEVVKLLAIRPDVIAVNVIQSPTTEAGDPKDGHQASALYIVARQGDAWKIVAGTSTFLGGPPA